MYQRDYILRIIEQLGQALRELRSRIAGPAADRADVHHELRELAARAAIDLELVRAVDPSTLRIIVFPAGEPDPARCWFIAELLYLDGMRLLALGDREDGEAVLSRAEELFSWIPPGWAPPAGLPSARDRLDELRGEQRPD